MTQSYNTVKVEKENGITWVILNRPEKRNAMNPKMHYEMLDLISDLETDEETQVLVITGAGGSWCAGQDLREYFRGLNNNPKERQRARWASEQWRWEKLHLFPRPTIAMVNGYCFGGAFTTLAACDFAIAAEDAVFGLPEINFAGIPAGIVGKVLTEMLSYRDALYYAMTGNTFDGKKASELRLVNFAVPQSRLRAETITLAEQLKSKNPEALRTCKQALKTVRSMNYHEAYEYLKAKTFESRYLDRENGREKAYKQFLDEKQYRPGLGSYDRKQ